MQPPTVSVVSGAPTPAEVAAIEAAIIALWRADVAAAVPSKNRWLEAGRREGLDGAAAHERLRWG